MKILLTAFEAFNNDDINPSEEILKKIDKNNAMNIDKILLPVSYEKSKKILLEKIDEYKPDFILSLGYASSRKEVSIEKIAYNETKANISDNDGDIRKEGKIIEGPLSLSTNICVSKLVSDLKEFNIYESLDAGRYICNEVYYISLLKLKGNALFIHIPPLDIMKEDGKKLDYLIEIIKEIIWRINDGMVL